ncbi:LysM peptidoglycan-binding domain-containing protein [Pseudarthrobacter sp. NamE2]|uniref:LysM peptidoglycan-binding domain-containing protein n=1 Tax=Pseudarthrobacter sp. NamE2 TaxID=2576838 RepID=UPI0010FEB6EA|nr:LysM peptidoglycan-binding domain-containing protein [Pseudarthrobacter sp. NamE2]TLM84968.1 LysM peptidoglycan-binding domain-containing protein [Pseudarthrobacter sp. NamE2]
MSAISASQVNGRHVPAQRTKPAQQVKRGQQAHQRPAPLPPLRLTRRGKVVLIGIPMMLLAALLLSLAGFFNSPAKASDAPEDLAVTPTVTVTVQPGESLWAIAGSVAPGRDARDVVAEIVQLNNLSEGTVLPGQQLYIPTR